MIDQAAIDKMFFQRLEYINDYTIEYNTDKPYYLLYGAVVRSSKRENPPTGPTLPPKREILAFQELEKGAFAANGAQLDSTFSQGGFHYRFSIDKGTKSSSHKKGLHISLNDRSYTIDLGEEAYDPIRVIHKDVSWKYSDSRPIALFTEPITLLKDYSEEVRVVFQLGFLVFDNSDYFVLEEYIQSELFKSFVEFGSVHESKASKLVLENFNSAKTTE